ncbi:sensor histidine kinase [Dissulfuribacter thermophilus]|uniref:histidine kinase n=1 Tax=Dissulfuribacter thermophilus TaxID=1156395 RepID=A0A1B9F306_9BACT|nr:response regulator [Dissulfuribacter thermophilus]OCC14316.1 sensor histidine kinase [Dissulfuribacter thermophilus]
MEKKILLVEDDKNMLNSLLLLFKHSGFFVTGVSSVKEALNKMQEVRYDVVVTDLVLPDGEGFDIMVYCKENGLETKVIAMTGYATLDSVVTALRKGAYDYVVKPFDFDILKHAVEKAFEAIDLRNNALKLKERYAELVEYLDDGFFVLEGTKLLYANEAMARHLGVPKKSLIGTNITDYLEPDHKKSFESKLKGLSSPHSRPLLEEFTFVKRDSGERLIAEVKLSSSPSEGGKNKFIGLIRDIGERKKLWEQLVRAEKLALMGEMVAGIAHELNNKLTPILAYVDLLTKEGLPEHLEKKLGIILNAALGAKGIVESLLLFSRQEKPKIGPCDINELLEASKDLVSASFRGSNVEVITEFDPDLPLVKGDPLQLEQVFSNIIKNAFEALGGNGKIILRSTQIGDDVVVTIEDTGPGIPSNIISKIFEPFFSTKGRGRGTGLGLSLCYGIIKEHGGDISVCCNNQGTRFSIMLPAEKRFIHKSLAETRPNSENAPRSMLGKKRILLVEDEPEIAALLTEILGQKFDVSWARNGDEALRSIESNVFDLIVSDIRMPGLDGIALYQQLREMDPSYCKKIVYTTGITCDDRTRKFLDESGVECVRKPFRIAELMGILEKKLLYSKQPNGCSFGI